MRTPLSRALGVAALATIALAACGSDDDGDDTSSPSGTEEPGGEAIVVDALDALRFDPETLTAPAGEIAFELVNEGSLAHTFVIEDHEDDLKLSVGSSDSGSITLEAGEYVFYCDIAGHRAGGMEGTLTVE